MLDRQLAIEARLRRERSVNRWSAVPGVVVLVLIAMLGLLDLSTLAILAILSRVVK